MNRTALLWIAASITAIIVWLARSYAPRPPVYTLEYADGDCTATSQCTWAGNGCGGGHGACTSNPDKYPGDPANCDINMDFPFNKGYICGCIRQLGKCGWVK